MDISKQDWDLYKEKLPAWQESYMEHLTRTYIELLNDPNKRASDKFWALENRIKYDRRHPGVIVERNRQTMIPTLIRLMRDQVISEQDLSDFSDDIKQAVAAFLRYKAHITPASM